MKYSIKRQMLALFTGAVALVIVMMFIINSSFMERFFIQNKKIEMVELYETLDKTAKKGDINSVEIQEELQRQCERKNCAVLVINSGSDITFNTEQERKGRLFTRLIGYIVGKDIGRVLEERDSYKIYKIQDQGRGEEYMDMVGQLADESIFIIRSPYGSIYDTVNSTNKFLICGGGVTVLCGLLFVWFFSQKITKPIMELAELSQRMANLDFNAKYTSGGENEIGILGGNFNLMSKRLEETITELKRANNQLQKDIEQKEKIEDMRNEFLGNVSHELKTPIALIQGYAEGLRDGITEDPESMEFYCDVIIDEANKMNQMVKNLLTLNQLEFGDEDLEITRFNLVGLIRGVLASCEILLQQAEAEVDCVTEEEVYVWADEFKTEQVFRNYLTNAIHHVDNEKRIEIRIIPQGDTVRVTVFNSGKPIPEEDIAKLWDKFYKVDKAHTREYGGNGIGLSIVKAIMESFHQQYGVKNYDNGVEFWFELDSKTSKCDSKVQGEET